MASTRNSLNKARQIQSDAQRLAINAEEEHSKEVAKLVLDLAKTIEELIQLVEGIDRGP